MVIFLRESRLDQSEENGESGTFASPRYLVMLGSKAYPFLFERRPRPNAPATPTSLSHHGHAALPSSYSTPCSLFDVTMRLCGAHTWRVEEMDPAPECVERES